MPHISILQYFQKSIQPRVDIPGKQSFHFGKIMSDMISIEGVIIRFYNDINYRKSITR